MRKLCVLAVLLCLLGSSVFAAFSAPVWSTQACRTRNDTGTPPGSLNNVDSSKLTIRSADGFGQKSWIRFDLTGIDMTGVRGATLTITSIENEVAGCTLSVSALNDSCHDNDTWTESNLTWNNAPGNYNTVEGDITDWAALAAAKTTLLESLVFTPGLVIGQSVSIDVFSAIQADTDDNVQFILHDSTDNLNFATWDYSGELGTGARPYLTLEYVPAGADYPNPAFGSTVTTGLSSLSWTLPEPNVPGTPIWCDVYLGTDPNRPQMIKKPLGNNVTTIAISEFGTLTDNTMYYWFVDCHDSSRLPNPVPGEQWSFTVDNNIAPSVDEIVGGIDQVLWGSFPYIATLDAVVSDDGLPNPPAALTYLWEQTAGPVTAVINSPNAEDTTVTIAERGDYRFQLTVSDSVKSTQASQQVVVGVDACDASHIDTGADYNKADVNKDCIVDVDDLQILIIDKWLHRTD